ncbi:MAG: succinyl-diaminopimelate desuccinylase [Rickettsiaceae bacterium]|nr:succinyl-diaminopimelate desuccinylase [Rickettsiaceae bacterium]
MNQEILTILQNLISYKSVTPKGADAIEYISNKLSKCGFSCEVKSFGEGEEKVTNLYAIYGDKKPNICFAGHLDVVPAGRKELWSSDPYKLKIDGNNVYGRGAVDMKGAIACSLAAVIHYLELNKPNGSISFLLTTDEEGEAKYGTKMMLEHIKRKEPSIDFCILGEPTTMQNIGDTIKIGRRGSVNFGLTINGKQGHVAYPEKAINPLPIMVSILKEINEEVFDNGNEFFQSTNLQLTSIDTGNQVTNIIPESVNAKFNIRFNNTQNANDLAIKVTKIVSKYSDNYDIKHKSSSAPFIQEYSKKMRAFASIVENECRVKPKIETGGGTSDARFIHKHAEVVEFGLNCNLAHKINEHTKISDLQTLYNVYYNTLVKFL